MPMPGRNPFANLGAGDGNGSSPARGAPQPPAYSPGEFSNIPRVDKPEAGDVIDIEPSGTSVVATEAQAKAYDGPEVIDYHENKIIGLDKCPRCGSASMEYSIEKVALVCQSCRFEDQGVNVAERFGTPEGISKLNSRTVTSGAQKIITDEVQVTIKCQGCGAEVSVDTDKSLQARCHWCRQPLSINNQIPNGAVPDGILPFRITKEEAMANVTEFVKARRAFANTRFKAEFKAENVFGVYLPYVIADVKFTGGVEGVAEKHLRSYTRGSGNSKTTYYDYEEYDIKRELAVLADDMSLEASSKRQIETASNTNNVINAVQPFPIKEAVDFRAHYLTNFNAERRDMDVDELDQNLVQQMLTVIRAKADASADAYEKRGIRWEREWTKLIGAHQASVYLPIWLYSFVEENAKNPRTKQRGQLIHYIAVNGVTGETMGSIPINWGKLQAVSWAIGLAVGVPSIYTFGVLHGIVPIFW